MSNRFKTLLQWILKWEGSTFTNDPDDRGGATRYGVIQTRYDQYRKQISAEPRSVEFIEMAEVEAIYRTYYWDVIAADLLPVPLDLALFNVAVNSGPNRALRWATALSVSASPLDQARAICDRYEQFYKDIVARDATQHKFLRGWLNRLEDCRQEIEESAASAEPTWSLMLGEKPLGPAWSTPEGRAFYPARKLLEAVLGTAEVGAYLSVIAGQVCWQGRAIPVDEIQREPGQMWVSIRDTAKWLGLEIAIDGKDRTISIMRNLASAKAQGLTFEN